jgi:hypothetical protein
MIFGRKGFEVVDVFSVFDAENRSVENIPVNEFLVDLFSPNGTNALATHPVSFSEMEGGHYRVTFTPLSEGLYYLIVYHTIYFPCGKGGHFQIFSDDFSSIGAMIEIVKDFENGRWRIDKTLNQMIFFKDDNITEIARFNLYDSAGNPTIDNVFERRRI